MVLEFTNKILDHEFPDFDPNHTFLTSIEAEIITFLVVKGDRFCFFDFAAIVHEYFNVAPLPELKIRY